MSVRPTLSRNLATTFALASVLPTAVVISLQSSSGDCSSSAERPRVVDVVADVRVEDDRLAGRRTVHGLGRGGQNRRQQDGQERNWPEETIWSWLASGDLRFTNYVLTIYDLDSEPNSKS